jgi:hypothetical protein
MSTVEERAYAAGFIDAAGYVTLSRIKSKCYRVPYVQVTNADSDIIWFFQLTFGGRTQRRKMHHPNHNDSFNWYLTYDAALKFLEEIRPFMQHAKKQQRVDIMLADYKKVTRRNGKYTEKQFADKIAFEERVMGIKMRGT